MCVGGKQKRCVRQAELDRSSVCSFWEIPAVGWGTEIRARKAGNEPLFFGAVVNKKPASLVITAPGFLNLLASNLLLPCFLIPSDFCLWAVAESFQGPHPAPRSAGKPAHACPGRPLRLFGLFWVDWHEVRKEGQK